MTRRYTGGFLSAKEQATDANSANGIFTVQEAGALTAAGAFPTGRWTPQNSLRFKRASSTYLNRTAVSPTDGKKATFSFWIKKVDISTDTNESYRAIFYCGTPNSDGLRIGFARYDGYDTHQFVITQDNGSSASYFTLKTAAGFRDPSAWYHFIIRYDSTDATADNRVKMYVNGNEITSFLSRTNPPLNHIPKWQVSTTNLKIGRGRDDVNEYNDMYLSEVNFIDGQALTPSAFGLTDPQTGTWVPKRYTGTYGNNGYYLPFNQQQVTTFSADFLVVAGGGGGGSNRGGGGGGGGFRTSAGTSGGNSSAESALTLLVGNAYTVTVGAGGGSYANGNNSVFASITSLGGGKGGGASSGNPSSGGSGGGGAGDDGVGEPGFIGQGLAGGVGEDNGGSGRGGGGGGGAGQYGGTGVNGTYTAGNGGNGLASTISGSSVTYSAGGGGGYLNNGTAGTAGTGGSSGLGGAGASGSSGGTGGSASSNTGSGGGGAAAVASGGSGGSGIVVIKIPQARSASFSGGVTYSGGTPTGGYKIYTVTATSTSSETVTFS